MAQVRKKSGWITFPMTILLFFGGGWAGAMITDSVAPDGVISALIGFMMLPLAFITGYYFWIGLAFLSLLIYWIRRLFGSKKHDDAMLQRLSEIPPGSYVFLINSVIISGICGTIIALASSDEPFLYTTGLYLATGTLYGLLCWTFARTGLLPFPEEN
jgi:hypothetical protein